MEPLVKYPTEIGWPLYVMLLTSTPAPRNTLEIRLEGVNGAVLALVTCRLWLRDEVAVNKKNKAAI